jgi:hypothetical protein
MLSPIARYCNRVIKADTEEYPENRFVKNWLSFLVLVTFIRLQFVCCCGSIDHVHLESQPCLPHVACCPAESEHKCDCSHHHAKPDSGERIGTLQIESKSSCGCQLCDQEHSHVPHLFAAEHLRIVSSPNVTFESLVAQQALPIVAIALSDFRYSRSSSNSGKCMHCEISILCQFGHLRI